MNQKYHISIYIGNPLIRTLVIRDSNYPARLGPSAKFVENSIKLLSFKIAGYRSKYSTVQYSTVQYSTVQYSTVQYSNALNRNSECERYAFSDS